MCLESQESTEAGFGLCSFAPTKSTPGAANSSGHGTAAAVLVVGIVVGDVVVRAVVVGAAVAVRLASVVVVRFVSFVSFVSLVPGCEVRLLADNMDLSQTLRISPWIPHSSYDPCI